MKQIIELLKSIKFWTIAIPVIGIIIGFIAAWPIIEEWMIEEPIVYVGKEIKAEPGKTIRLIYVLPIEHKTEKAIVNDCVEVGEERSVAALESRGFVVSVSYEHSDTVEAGIVISQSPVANTEAEVGSTVYLVVSSGPDTTYVTVPYCIGFTQTGARELCEDAGLVVSISEIPDNDNIGRVLTQSIESGESVEEGTTIVLGVGVEEETEAPSTESTRETATEGSSSGEETTS